MARSCSEWAWGSSPRAAVPLLPSSGPHGLSAAASCAWSQWLCGLWLRRSRRSCRYCCGLCCCRAQEGLLGGDLSLPSALGGLSWMVLWWRVQGSSPTGRTRVEHARHSRFSTLIQYLFSPPTIQGRVKVLSGSPALFFCLIANSEGIKRQLTSSNSEVTRHQPTYKKNAMVVLLANCYSLCFTLQDVSACLDVLHST